MFYPVRGKHGTFQKSVRNTPAHLTSGRVRVGDSTFPMFFARGLPSGSVLATSGPAAVECPQQGNNWAPADPTTGKEHLPPPSGRFIRHLPPLNTINTAGTRSWIGVPATRQDLDAQSDLPSQIDDRLKGADSSPPSPAVSPEPFLQGNPGSWEGHAKKTEFTGTFSKSCRC